MKSTNELKARLEEITAYLASNDCATANPYVIDGYFMEYYGLKKEIEG